jgi:phosphatidylserine/phosphatidylglycerophosphate/cardiolipin synthase-like enzyme
MIKVDAGNELSELLTRAKQLGDRARLDVAVPFFDTDSHLWQLLSAAAQSGSRVRLLTRPAEDALQVEHFSNLSDLGVRLVHLPRIHAKAVLLCDRGGRHSMGWIGSHNFTKTSERTAEELGIVFSGMGSVEIRLLQEAMTQLDAWAYQARTKHKLNLDRKLHVTTKRRK